MDASVPRIEVADDAEAARIGRPDRERHSGDTAQLARMRAEHLVGPLVLEFAEQMEVEVAERGQKAVRIVNRGRSTAAKENLEPVGEQLAPSFQPYLEDSGRVNARQLAPILLAVLAVDQ